MPKVVKVSLKPIVKQIDTATGQLTAAKGKALTAIEKKRLDAKIKNLKKIRKHVAEICHHAGLTLAVPTK